VGKETHKAAVHERAELGVGWVRVKKITKFNRSGLALHQS